MFGAKKGTNYDGLNIPTLPPAIYKGGELKDVKKDRTTPKDGGEGTAILTYTLEFPEGSHQVTEYDIKADAKDKETKSKNEVSLKTLISTMHFDPKVILESEGIIDNYGTVLQRPQD